MGQAPQQEGNPDMIRAKGSKRVTRKEWYAAGGFANSACWRRADKRGVWQYFIRQD